MDNTTQNNELLAERIKAGHRELLPALWQGVRGYVYKMARAWLEAFSSRHDVDIDDLMNSGYIAMLKAIESFDASAECSFIAFLKNHLKSEFSIAYYIRTDKQLNDPLNNALSLDAPIDMNETDGDTLGTTLTASGPDEYAAIDEGMAREWLSSILAQALANIPPDEAAILKQHYLEEMPFSAIAKREQLPETKVRQQCNDALRRLRNDRLRDALREFDSGFNFYQHSSHGMTIQERYLFQKENIFSSTIDEDKAIKLSRSALHTLAASWPRCSGHRFSRSMAALMALPKREQKLLIDHFRQADEAAALPAEVDAAFSLFVQKRFFE